MLVCQRCEPPEADDKYFPETGSREPVWTGQEAFHHRSIDLCQSYPSEKMDHPCKDGKSFFAFLSCQKAFNKANITEAIASDKFVPFHRDTVDERCCCS